MADEYEIHVETFPVYDTGLGRELGYRDDAHMVDVAAREREEALSVLTPEARKRLEDAEVAADRRFLLGG